MSLGWGIKNLRYAGDSTPDTEEDELNDQIVRAGVSASDIGHGGHTAQTNETCATTRNFVAHRLNPYPCEDLVNEAKNDS